MKVIVTGANGQLGSLLIQALGVLGHEVVGLTHEDISIEDMGAVAYLKGLEPFDALINTAAYHRVDDCGDCPTTAFKVNTLGVQHLAQACRHAGARFQHMSTDYVFGEDGLLSHHEGDATDPVNWYGLTKLAGEKAALAEWWNVQVIRAGALYGPSRCRAKGESFVTKMLRLVETGKDIRVVDDQTMSPTLTVPLAEKMVTLLEDDDGVVGIFHCACEGSCTWAEFAQAIFDESNLDVSVIRVSSDEYPTKERRPSNTALENARLVGLGIPPMMHWRDGLQAYLKLMRN